MTATVTAAILARAHAHDLALSAEQIIWRDGEAAIDGMIAEQWIDAMTDVDRG